MPSPNCWLNCLATFLVVWLSGSCPTSTLCLKCFLKRDRMKIPFHSPPPPLLTTDLPIPIAFTPSLNLHTPTPKLTARNHLPFLETPTTATSDLPNRPCRQTPTLRPPHGSRPSARYSLAKPDSVPPISSMDQHTTSHRAITSARTAARPKTSNRQRNRQTRPGRESPPFFAIIDSVELRTGHGSK